MNMPERMKEKAAELFGADVRSLAALRISLALLILVDLAARALDLTAHYTDGGVLPRDALDRVGPLAAQLLPHFLGGSTLSQGVVFVIAAVAAVSLLLGYRAKIAVCVSWFLLMSLHARNPLLLYGSDHLLRLLLFWSMFVPLDGRWALTSARRRTGAPTSLRIVSVGTVCLLAQPVLMYIFAGLSKNTVGWQTGQALHDALQVETLVRPFGSWLLQAPALVTVFAKTIKWVEIFVPVLLFAPMATGPLRLLAVVMLSGLQLGFGLSFGLGLFPWVCTAAMLPFLPAVFWEVVGQGWRSAFSLRSWNAALQAGRERRPAVTGERVSIHPGRSSRKAGRQLLNRSWWTGTVAAVLLVYMVAWNLQALGVSPVRISHRVSRVGRVLGLNRSWVMFTRSVAGGWPVVPGQLQDGTQVDILRGGGAIDWDRPAMTSTIFREVRWAVYLKNLILKSSQSLGQKFGAYLCDDWNGRHEGSKRLKRLSVVFMARREASSEHGVPQHDVVRFDYACARPLSSGWR